MTTKRRTLTDSEHKSVKIYIKNTNIAYLESSYRTKFEGIAEVYRLDGCLSDSQIKVLKTSKYVSDMKKRDRNYYCSTSTPYDKDFTQKLDIVFNPIGR